MRACPSFVKKQPHPKGKPPPPEKRDQGRSDQNHDPVLKPGGPIRTQPSQHKEKGNSDPGNHPRGQPWEAHQDFGHGFSEIHTVKSDGDGLRQEQHSADSPAELHAQGSGNQVIVPSPFHLQIGGNGRQGYAGQHRNGVGQADHDQGPPQARVSHHIAQPEKQDNPQDGQNTGGKHTGKCPQFAVWGFKHKIRGSVLFHKTSVLRCQLSIYLLSDNRTDYEHHSHHRTHITPVVKGQWCGLEEDVHHRHIHDRHLEQHRKKYGP